MMQQEQVWGAVVTKNDAESSIREDRCRYLQVVNWDDPVV